MLISVRRASRVRAVLARNLSSEPSHPSESFLSGSSSLYLEQQMESWKRDPTSVHVSWQCYFSNLASGMPASSGGAFSPPPNDSLQPKSAQPSGALFGALPSDSLGISHLIRAYQFSGHKAACLDPLNLHTTSSFPFDSRVGFETGPLSIEYHGFTQADMHRELVLKGNSSGGNAGFLEELSAGPKVTLRQILTKLRETYCGTLGVEYMHIGDFEKCNWIRERVESPAWQSYGKDKTMHIFERLCYADTFEVSREPPPSPPLTKPYLNLN